MAEEVQISTSNPIDELRLNLESLGLELTEDGHIRWDKKNPAHPRNWTTWRKAYNTGVVLFLELVT
jgi:hypothetical protein